MRFALSDEQVAFRDAARDLLAKECSPAVVRAAWDAPPGKLDRGVWSSLEAMGVLGVLVAEADGGMGLDETYLVPILEECGRVALPHPIVETAMVAAPLLGSAVGMATTDLGGPLIPCAADSDVLLRCDGQRLVTVVSADAGLAPVSTVDRARRAASVEPGTLDARSGHYSSQAGSAVEPGTTDARSGHYLSQAGSALEPGTTDARSGHYSSQAGSAVEPGTTDARSGHYPTHADVGEAAVVTEDPAMVELAWDRGALGTAAFLIGLGQAMLDMTVEYVRGRHQFGKPIGSFQAVKHHLADAAVALELARPAVQRAAWSAAHGAPTRARDVSMAKAMASDAAELVGRQALQCHGAMGYTVEADLHLFLKRTWALARSWGDTAFHTDRVADALRLPHRRTTNPIRADLRAPRTRHA